MPWIPTTMLILVDSRLKNEVYMHYFFVRVCFFKIFSLSLRVDPGLKNEVYMHYFFGVEFGTREDNYCPPMLLVNAH